MSLNRNPTSSLPSDHFDDLSLQTIDSLPDELLLPIFDNLSPFERALLLQTCKKWKQVILLHTPFWQYLHLSENFSPSSIVKILSIFNERSECRLKHVIIEAKILSSETLQRILVELKRSRRSLKVAALHQAWKLNEKTRAIAMQHFPMLDSLLTVSGIGSFQSSVAYMFEQRARLGIQDGSNNETGLRFFATESLSEIAQEDLKWLSKLNCLEVTYTDDIVSMRKILDTTENLVDLDLAAWTTLKEPSSNTIESLSLNSNPVHLRSLKRVVCPIDCTFALALSQLLELDGDQTLLSGPVDSLSLWKVIGLKEIKLQLLPLTIYRTSQPAPEKTRLLFQLNSTVQSLTLCCSGGGYGAVQQLNQVLEILGTPLQSQNPGMIAGGEEKSSDLDDNLLLPNLVKLTIEDPVKLDGNTLRKLVKARIERNIPFQFELKASETSGGTSQVVVIDNWEPKGWMN